MSNNGIEDIFIENGYKSPKKKKGKGKIVFFFFLIIVVIALGGAYWYYNNMMGITSTKAEFLEHLSNTNIDDVVSDNAYKTILTKFLSKNSTISSSINFTTNVDMEELEGLDVSNFTLDLSLENDVKNSETYAEIDVDYSGNKVLEPIKVILNEDSLAVASDEIVNRYVAYHYDSLKDLFGIDIDADTVSDIRNLEEIELTDDEKQEVFSNIVSILSENISEESITVQDNIAITKDSESVPVTAYTLTLSQNEYADIMSKILTDLKENEDLLNKLVSSETSKEDDDVEDEEIENESESDEENIDEETSNQVEEENVDEETEENLEEENEETDLEGSQSSSLETVGEEIQYNETQVIDGEEVEDEESADEIESTNQELELKSTTNLEVVGADSDAIYSNISQYIEFVKLLFGYKTNMTLDEIQDVLDDCISNIKNSSGNGLTVTVYVSSEKTEKINLVLPNENTIDLEILTQSDSENSIKLTYLYKGSNGLFNFSSSDDTKTYSAEDDIDIDTNDSDDQTNGITIEIDKTATSSSTTYDVTCSLIENEVINKKINIKSEVSGLSSSTTIKDNSVITVSTNENETKATIETSIKFSADPDIEDLTEENSLYMDSLSEEDYVLVMQEIKDKIDSVWEDKKEQFDFIDTNNTSSTIVRNSLSNASNSITQDEAREALENRINDLKEEKEANGEEISINILENLEIDGYEVSSVVDESSAIVVIDVYTFNVDSEFNVSDAE